MDQSNGGESGRGSCDFNPRFLAASVSKTKSPLGLSLLLPGRKPFSAGAVVGCSSVLGELGANMMLPSASRRASVSGTCVASNDSVLSNWAVAITSVKSISERSSSKPKLLMSCLTRCGFRFCEAPCEVELRPMTVWALRRSMMLDCDGSDSEKIKLLLLSTSCANVLVRGGKRTVSMMVGLNSPEEECDALYSCGRYVLWCIVSTGKNGGK